MTYKVINNRVFNSKQESRNVILFTVRDNFSFVLLYSVILKFKFKSIYKNPLIV